METVKPDLTLPERWMTYAIFNYALTAAEVLNLKRAHQPRSVRVLKWVETQ
jgi:hypothetical protein